jgi:hypothetical protein
VKTVDRLICAVLLTLVAALPGSSKIAAAQSASSSYGARNEAVEASFSRDGAYSLKFLATGWTLDGKLPEPVARILSSSGTDKIGAYHALSVTYRNGARAAEIRVYDHMPIALLRETWKSAGPNELPFPSFQQLPKDALRFSYKHRVFGHYEFGTLGPHGPWMLFDQQGHAVILSPADHFLVSEMKDLPGGAEIGITAAIQTLPAGFSHGTLIAAGKGINETFATWGHALLALSGKKRPTNESGVILSKLGYWTDNGAVYYYHFEPQLGYAGTLLAIRDEFKKLGIPLGYMQLDSWFYPKGDVGKWDAKGGTLSSGEYVYRADKTLFAEGLASFQKSLGLPIVTHARWISPASPYHHEFKMSANVIVDSVFWKTTASYLEKAGDVTYEQDWLNQNALPKLNLQDPEAFLGNMSSAMKAAGLNIQYCMPLPAHYMASTLYSNVETIRASDDRLTPQKWDEFLYDSRLASAVGLWPWTDVFMSTELPNLIVSTLSAGPVGVGDALGKTNVQNLMAVVRADGYIIKPDTSLLPIDAMYASDAVNQQAPMVAMAETKFSGAVIRYVFAYPRRSTDTETSVPLHELGFSGPAYAYDWVAHTGSLVPADGSVAMHFKDGFSYDVVVPVNREGLALLGETQKIVPLGRKRVAALEDHGALTAAIKFGRGEAPIAISGYAAHQPKLHALKGKLERESYDPGTKIFQAKIAPGTSGDAVLRISARH